MTREMQSHVYQGFSTVLTPGSHVVCLPLGEGWYSGAAGRDAINVKFSFSPGFFKLKMAKSALCDPDMLMEQVRECRASLEWQHRATNHAQVYRSAAILVVCTR